MKKRSLFKRGVSKIHCRLESFCAKHVTKCIRKQPVSKFAELIFPYMAKLEFKLRGIISNHKPPSDW